MRKILKDVLGFGDDDWLFDRITQVGCGLAVAVAAVGFAAALVYEFFKKDGPQP